MHLQEGEKEHEHCDHQFHRGHLKRTAPQLVAGQGGKVPQTQKGRGPHEGGYQRRQAKAQDHRNIGVFSHQGHLKKIVNQVDQRRETDGRFQGEKEGKDRKKEGAQAEAREKGEACGEKRGQGGEEVGEHGSMGKGRHCYLTQRRKGAKVQRCKGGKAQRR